MSNFRKNTTPGGASSSKKYAVVNTTIFKPPPTAQHGVCMCLYSSDLFIHVRLLLDHRNFLSCHPRK